MGFRITFKDNNVAEEGHNIYRSGSPMDPQNMPPPVASVGADVQQWEDGEVTPGATYYYRVGAFTAGGSVELISEEFEAEAVEVEFAEAVFTFEEQSVSGSPVNQVSATTGLASSLSVAGNALTWSLAPVAVTPDSEARDVDPVYDIGWPADPVVDPAGDWTVRTSGTDLTFEIRGLDDGKSYDLSFVGSRSDGQATRDLSITILGVTKSIDAFANSTETVDFTGVAPSSGIIAFTFTTLQSWGYLSALYIKG